MAKRLLRDTHGKRASYRYGGCRCADCTKANTDYCRAERRRRGVRPREVVNAERRLTVRHGTRHMYARLRCRCAVCQEWSRTHRRRFRPTDRKCPTCGAAVNGPRGLGIHRAKMGCAA